MVLRESTWFGALLAVSVAHAAESSPPPNDAIAGAWSYDAALSAPQADAGDGAAASGALSAGAGHHHGSGGGMGGGGAMGGSHGGGGHHHGDRAAPAATAGSSGKEELAERGERGLSRMFAKHVTITPLKQRIRLDDGDHIVELDRDGMNVSGPGVGGTVALSATKPDFVVQTLTDSGYALEERYHLADDGQHLELHIDLKRPGVEQATQFVRVFDRPALATSVAAVPLPPAH
ncbi:MAG TPA: hypothetical protein VGC55_12300 [Dokdonella sp.]